LRQKRGEKSVEVSVPGEEAAEPAAVG
jgi:hypothetical protein